MLCYVMLACVCVQSLPIGTRFSTLTAWYSSVISVTFARKGLHEVVWDAHTVFAARVHVTGLADTL